MDDCAAAVNTIGSRAYGSAACVMNVSGFNDDFINTELAATLRVRVKPHCP